MTIKIYQLDNSSPYIFRDYKFAKDNELFNFKDYHQVYECQRDADYTLDKCFEEFNNQPPKDFNGHSLSVSDIIEIDGDKEYCDSFGWQKIN